MRQREQPLHLEQELKSWQSRVKLRDFGVRTRRDEMTPCALQKKTQITPNAKINDYRARSIKSSALASSPNVMRQLPTNNSASSEWKSHGYATNCNRSGRRVKMPNSSWLDLKAKSRLKIPAN